VAGLTWVLEAGVFSDSDHQLRAAALAEGLQVLDWDDDWWTSGRWPRLGTAVFHGSLGNAARIAVELPWRPGAYCATDAFRCTRWYPRASPWLLHRRWASTTVEALVADPAAALRPIGSPDEFFVRPDSPLKPFSGRVLRRVEASFKALDHGFYYDDASLPIVVTPVERVGREWRYVVVGGRVTAGSAYQADGRAAAPDDSAGDPWRFAADIASALDAPEAVFVLDIGESDRGLRLIELNPFSGADLYACERSAIVRAVAELVGAS
jgi:hypothetical protein